MFTKLVSGLVLFPAILLGSYAHGSAALTPRGPGYLPQTSIPSYTQGGQTFSVTVGISQPAESNLVFDISVSDNSMVSSIPSSVTIPVGSTSGSYSVTLSGSAQGSLTFTMNDGEEQTQASTIVSSNTLSTRSARTVLKGWFL